MRAKPNLYTVLTLVVAVIATASAQTKQSNVALPPISETDQLVTVAVPYLKNTTTKLRICTTPSTPNVECSPETAHTEWTGFEIEVFRLTTSRMGITDDMLEWICYGDKDQLLNDLYSNSCDLAAAGMAPTNDRIVKGLRFSVPSIRSGFSIMVNRKVQPPGTWYFFSAMAWQVWVLMIITGIIVGVIVWLFEVGMRSLNTNTHQMGRVMWDTMGRPVQMTDYRLSSFPANLTGVLWSFLVFILMAIYSANLTANLTINQFKSDVKGLADLPGKAVGSWYGFQEELLKYNIATMGLPWNGPADEVAMIDKLKSGVITALVFNTNLLEIYDATDCDTMLVGDPFDLRDQCVTFSARLWTENPEFTDAFDISMLSVVQGTGGVEELIDKFIKVAPAECKTNDFSSGYSQVTLEQVSGLWVILSVSILFGAIIVIGYRSWGRMQPYLQKKGWYKGTEKMAKSFNTFKRAGYSTAMSSGSLSGGGSSNGGSSSSSKRYGRQSTMQSLPPNGNTNNFNNNNFNGGGGSGGVGSINGRVPEIPIITMDNDDTEDDGGDRINSMHSSGAAGAGAGNGRSGGRVSFIVGDVEAQK